MKEQDFMEIVDRQHTFRKSLLSNPDKKRTAGTDDRLLQFRRMAAMRKCTVESAAIDLCTKQFTDLIDMADCSHPKHNDVKFLSDLIADVQNYLDILLAITTERVPT